MSSNPTPKNCLLCYDTLENGEFLGHAKCCKRLFGRDVFPQLDVDQTDLEKLALQGINRRLAVTGVQRKLSLDLNFKKDAHNPRMTVVGLWGHYILKPPTDEYPHIVEFEDVTMHLAQACAIETAAHGLIPLRSGELCYISKRFDRDKKEKLAQEDFCQLTETLTENKYNSSHEKAAKPILKWSSNPGLDLLRYFDLLVFSFITGNADMHLKNFSLLTLKSGQIKLAPAYDLLCTIFINPDDNEEMALPIQGKKAKIKGRDFFNLGKHLGIVEKAMENSLTRFEDALPNMNSWIDRCFLPENLKESFKDLIQNRITSLQS